MADTKPPVATPEELATHRKAVESEWGTYVALVPIAYNGVPAYNAGDPVPVSNVEKHGYLDQGLVAKVASKAGQETVHALHENISAPPAEQVPTVTLGVPVQ